MATPQNFNPKPPQSPRKAEIFKISQILGISVSEHTNIEASGYVRLYLASPNPAATDSSILKTFPGISSKEWTNSGVEGALVVIVSQKAMFFQIFNLSTYQPVFKYEVYENMEYRAGSDHLHAFEMEDCMAGFLFTEKNDADNALKVINSRKPTSKPGLVPHAPSSSTPPAPTKVSKKTPAKASKAPKKKAKKKKKRGGGLFGHKGVDEEFKVIGFEQRSHVGMNADGSFDLASLPDEWKRLFKDAGIRPKHLKNKSAALEIIKVIEEDDWKRKTQSPAAFSTAEQEAYRLQQEQFEVFEQHQRGLEAWEEDNKAILNIPAPELPPRPSPTAEQIETSPPPPPPAPPAQLIARQPSLSQAKPEVGLADMLKNVQLKKTEAPPKPEAPPPSAHDIFLQEILSRKLKKTVIPPKLPDAVRFNDGRKNSIVRKLQDAMDARREVFQDDDDEDDSDYSWSDIDD